MKKQSNCEILHHELESKSQKCFGARGNHYQQLPSQREMNFILGE